LLAFLSFSLKKGSFWCLKSGVEKRRGSGEKFRQLMKVVVFQFVVVKCSVPHPAITPAMLLTQEVESATLKSTGVKQRFN